ncbi:hypothetical protein B7P43_G13050, partial [Cryptotermes secundus]
LFVSGNPDILICGNCREMFTELQELLDHKKTYCKLRFTCKCHTLNGVKTKSPGEDFSSSAMLLCVLCKDSFQSAWDLMVHVQAAHMMNIYELGVPKSDSTVKGEQTSQQTSPATSPCPCPIHDKEVVSTKRAYGLSYPRFCFSLTRSSNLVSGIGHHECPLSCARSFPDSRHPF